MAAGEVREDRSSIAHREGGGIGGGNRKPIARTTGSATPVEPKSDTLTTHGVVGVFAYPEMTMPLKQITVLISTDYAYRFEEGLHLYDRAGFNIGYADGLAPEVED